MKLPKVLRVKIPNPAVTLLLMGFVTLLSFLFRQAGFHESNIIMAYLLGVLLVSTLTDGFLYGIAASVIGVLTFNFFFTQPYYSFTTHRKDYPVTFAIMLVVALITSTLTARIKEAARTSAVREKRAQVLYQTNKNMLKARNLREIVEVGGKEIINLLHRSVVIVTGYSPQQLEDSHLFVMEEEKEDSRLSLLKDPGLLQLAVHTGRALGAGTDHFPEKPAYFLPIKGQNGVLGAVGISCFGARLLSGEQIRLLKSITAQLALAMERDRLSEEQQKAKMEAEQERIRSHLLRSIAHDLRTPLTGILGSAAAILDYGDALDEGARTKLLQGVYEDAAWLNNSFENILSLTRLDEGKIEMHKHLEAVEEVVAEAVSRVKKLSARHRLEVRIPGELIMLPMDGILIEQVLVNLLDNAVKYTPDGTAIEIRVYLEADYAVFEVADNGNGIPEESLPLIFNRFYTTSASHQTGRRGTGLGLAICKSIIEAHGGQITARNRPEGGAAFRFELPVKE